MADDVTDNPATDDEETPVVDETVEEAADDAATEHEAPVAEPAAEAKADAKATKAAKADTAKGGSATGATVTRKKVTSKRVTPKGGAPKSTSGNPAKRNAEEGFASKRVTAPIDHKYDMPSPWWVPTIMWVLLAAGVILIMLNYMGTFGDPSNLRLVLGLGLILGGIVTATQYR